MILVHSYPIAVALCILTMFCWGSWANTLKMEPRSYPFSLFYWDQSVGYLLLPLLIGLTFGSIGHQGRGLLEDLRQGSANSYGWAIVGGFVFNLANILFMAALDLAGMAVAYPIAIGIALVEGVLINYVAQPRGNPALIFGGVALIMVAIILDGLAYRNCQSKDSEPGQLIKGISLAISGGILMGLFYFLVQRSISPNFEHLEPGKFGPYAAVLVYCAGTFVSNFIINTYFMSHPVKGDLLRLFQERHFQVPHDRRTRRRYQRHWRHLELCRFEGRQSRHCLRPRPGRYHDRGHLGCLYLEGDQRRLQRHPGHDWLHVCLLPHRPHPARFLNAALER
jgi:glucose uptake protein